MINDKAILVGVDGSHASYKATWWAAQRLLPVKAKFDC